MRSCAGPAARQPGVRRARTGPRRAGCGSTCTLPEQHRARAFHWALCSVMASKTILFQTSVDRFTLVNLSIPWMDPNCFRLLFSFSMFAFDAYTFWSKHVFNLLFYPSIHLTLNPLVYTCIKYILFHLFHIACSVFRIYYFVHIVTTYIILPCSWYIVYFVDFAPCMYG